MDDHPTRHNKPAFPSFSSDDFKLLVVTFAGTAAANIVTVLFVGLAIAVAHWSGITHTPGPYLIILPVLTIAVIVVPIVTFTLVKHLRNRVKTRSDKIALRIMTICAVCLAGFALIAILTWVGVAAGIK